MGNFEQELVRELYHELVDLSEDDRNRILEERDLPPEVIAEVRSLCSFSTESELVKNVVRDAVDPVVEDSPRGPEEKTVMLPSSEDPRTSARTQFGLLPEGSSRYEIQEKLAQGGMGTIHRVRDRSLQRDLAMKVILDANVPSSASKLTPTASLVRRFVNEARIMGQLDHPGVVPIHDINVNEKDEVFFTMRLVHGITLKRVFEKTQAGEDGWNLTRTINTTLRVCETLAYAHSKGVIHRDIKPSNIMVGEFGETYVMDWGIAKVLGSPENESGSSGNPNLDEAPLEQGSEFDPTGDLKTVAGEVIGTPFYMPPEQARGEIDRIGLTADVYSMGAVLDHLLAKQPPYSDPDPSTPLLPIHRVIEGPPRDLSEIDASLPSELVAICRKAMSREPGHRYPDMGAMADDLRAFTEHRVVTAYRTGRLIEMRKWVRRNKILVGGVAATFLALVIGMTGTALGAIRATRERDAAVLAKEQLTVVVNFQSSNIETVSVSAVGRGMLADLKREFQAGLEKAGFSPRLRERKQGEFNELIDHVNMATLARRVIAGVFVKRARGNINEGFTTDPTIECQLRSSIARQFSTLGLEEDELEQWKIVKDIATEHLGEDHDQTVTATRKIGRALMKIGKAAEGEPYLREALERASSKHGPRGLETLECTMQLGLLLAKQDKLAEAERHFREAIEGFTEAAGEGHEKTQKARNELSVLLYQQEKYEEAIDVMEDLCAWYQKHMSPDHRDTLVSLNNLMAVLFKRGEFDRAEPVARDLVDANSRRNGDDHMATIRSRNNLGRVLFGLEKFEEAESVLRQAYTAGQKELPETHQVRVSCTSNLVDVLIKLSEPAQAEIFCRELLAVRRTLDPPQTGSVARSLEQLTICLLDQELFQEAEETARECLSIREKIDTNHWLTFKIRNLLGVALAGQGQFEEAEPLLTRSLARLREKKEEIPEDQRKAELSDAESRVTQARRWGQ